MKFFLLLNMSPEENMLSVESPSVNSHMVLTTMLTGKMLLIAAN
jgi:hypothetical protein